jgi:hypothetical protein
MPARGMTRIRPGANDSAVGLLPLPCAAAPPQAIAAASDKAAKVNLPTGFMEARPDEVVNSCMVVPVCVEAR